MPVKSENSQYTKFKDKWRRMRDTVTGQDAVHEAGPLYLPKLTEEKDPDYKARVKRTPFYNATWRTIAGLVGMIFRKDPQQEFPSSVSKEMLDDIDMQGTPFNIFINRVTHEALITGRLGLLVDVPALPADAPPLTVAAAERLGIRPFLTYYAAENIINWRTSRVNNRTVLSLVVLKEPTNVDGEDEFEQKSEDRYRVLDLAPDTNKYRVRIFRSRDGVADELIDTITPLKSGAPLDFIPFVFIGVNGIDIDVDDPPLIDLADLNLSHYRTSADYEHGCHFTGLPTAYIAGYSPEVGADGKPMAKTFHIGSPVVWTFTDPNAKAGYVEFTGQGLSALEKNLDRKEQQMAILGARMLAAEKKQAETATTAAIHRTGENSILSSVAISISLAIQKAMRWFVDWSGGTGDVEFELNREFLPVEMSPQQLTSLVMSWQSGAISDQDLFDNLQRGDVVRSDKTFEQQKTEIATSTPATQISLFEPEPATT